MKTLECLGGSRNVTDLVVCPTRLRIEVANPAVVDVPGLHAMGAIGVVVSGRIVQVVVGGDAPALAELIKAELSQVAPAWPDAAPLSATQLPTTPPTTPVAVSPLTAAAPIPAAVPAVLSVPRSVPGSLPVPLPASPPASPVVA
ncbi:MAG: PTS transporter subunit EIIB [Bifidobacteriaceae bacterium]|nr:PTS transporter subunit EIIB [Bifidobacteriaceae bacterium]